MNSVDYLTQFLSSLHYYSLIICPYRSTYGSFTCRIIELFSLIIDRVVIYRDSSVRRLALPIPDRTKSSINQDYSFIDSMEGFRYFEVLEFQSSDMSGNLSNKRKVAIA